jgi:hypothetical protein
MRTLNHPMILGLAVAFTLAGQALPATAGSFYRYETENGAVAFTDDVKHIPARYRDAAEPIARRSLDDFERFTPMAASQPASYAARLDGRLDHLRDLNQRTISPDAVQAPGAGHPSLAIGSGPNGQDVQAFLGSRQNTEPVIVETVRSRPDGSPVTRHITIVRQGEQVLSVIKGEQLHSRLRPVDERSFETND